MPIKYIGSKRRLVGVLSDLCARSGARTALDLFTGTTRVAQAFKTLGTHVTAVDTARYAHVFARCYVATDADAIDHDEIRDALGRLAALPGRDGYVTETFCRRARYFQPHNGRRIDAIRDAIESDYEDTPLYPVLLTSLIEAADRVDSTTGLQMAYLKRWAPRAHHDLELRMPALLPGSGTAIRADACEVLAQLPHVDLAYLDPPYNQHRYYTNYHVWETIVAWDAPEHYGVACKRLDARDPATKSMFNSKRQMPDALARVVRDVRADVVVLSYNDEAWIELPDLVELCAPRGHVAVLAFDSKRYVGAQIGVHDRSGKRVGEVSHLRNTEYLVVAGMRDVVERMLAEPVTATSPGRSEAAHTT